MKKRHSRHRFWHWRFGLVLLFLGSGPIACEMSVSKPYDSDGTIRLRFVSQFSRPSIVGASSRLFEEELKKRLGERLDIHSYYSGSLVGPEETLTAIGAGVADAGTGLWIYSPGRLPLGAFEYHFLFNDPDIRNQVAIKRKLFEIMPALSEELAAENIAAPLLFGCLSPYLILSKQPIKSVKDLRGKRVAFTPVEYVPLFKAVGAVPILSPAAEFYERLGLGIVDAVAISVEVLYFYRLHELAPYLLDVALNTPIPLSVWVNMDFWNALTPDDRNIFEEAGRSAERRYVDLLQIEIQKARQGFLKEGVDISTLDDASIEEWKALIPPIAENWAAAMDKRGLPGTELFQGYVRLSKKEGWLFDDGPVLH